MKQHKNNNKKPFTVERKNTWVITEINESIIYRTMWVICLKSNQYPDCWPTEAYSLSASPLLQRDSIFSVSYTRWELCSRAVSMHRDKWWTVREGAADLLRQQWCHQHTGQANLMTQTHSCQKRLAGQWVRLLGLKWRLLLTHGCRLMWRRRAVMRTHRDAHSYMKAQTHIHVCCNGLTCSKRPQRRRLVWVRRRLKCLVQSQQPDWTQRGTDLTYTVRCPLTQSPPLH